MKTLYIVRHAKSSWDYPELSDHERPLKKRGKNDAELMGHVLQKEGVSPELFISSHANRAHSTAQIIAGYLDYDKSKIIIDETLYFSGVSEIIDLLKETDDIVNQLMIFGHNPDFTSLANTLTGSNIINVPTCGVVAVQFDIDSWTAIRSPLGKQLFFYYPRLFK